jgi:hypothetical protein
MMVNVEVVKREKPSPPPRQPLLTEEIKARLPKLYSQEQKGLDAVAHVKFFAPRGEWTWYASEYDSDDLFFGLVVGFEIELGYFSKSELEGLTDQLGLPAVERDRHYQPKTLRELKQLHESQRRGEV